MDENDLGIIPNCIDDVVVQLGVALSVFKTVLDIAPGVDNHREVLRFIECVHGAYDLLNTVCLRARLGAEAAA